MRTYIKTVFLLLISAGMVYAAGSWSANGWSYKPQLTTQGTTDYAQFNLSQDKIDAKLANTKTFGDTGYTTLAESLTTIGSTNTRLIIPSTAAAVAVASGVTTTIPANVQLQVDKGAYFTIPTASTLTINGPIEAGPYQIFSWTGTGAINISASPTKDYYLEWFGGQASGNSFDNSTVLLKAAASVGSDHTWQMGLGDYGIKTATVIGNAATANNTTYGFHIRGMGEALSKLYINTPAAVGLTLGAVAANGDQGNVNLTLEGFSVVGPTTSCTDAIRIIKWHDAVINRVNFWVGGASGYGLDMQGCIKARVKVTSGRTYSNWNALYYWPGGATYPNAFHFEETSDAWGMNDLQLDVGVVQQYHNIGVNMEGGTVGASISGSVENCVYPLDIDGWSNVDVNIQYMIDNNTNGPRISNTKMVTLNNLYASFSSMTTALANCKNTIINNCRFDTLTIDANCRGTIINNYMGGSGLLDLAPDTQYIGATRMSTGFESMALPNRSTDRRNYISNFNLKRWKTDTPDGWTSPTDATLTDETSTVHLVPNSMKIVSSGAGTTQYNLSAAQLNAVLGRVVNLTMWVKMAAAQAFTTYPGIYIDLTVPARANSTSYTVGQAVTFPGDVSGNIYFCKVAGQSAGALGAYSTTQGAETVDNAATWIAASSVYTTYTSSPLVAGDIGNWKKLATGGLIPTNATALDIRIYQPQQTGAVNSTVYYAEPCLMVGWQGPDSLVQGQDEVASFIQVGDKRIWTTTPAGGAWVAVGDIDLSSGQRCTVAGAQGAGATWANFP